MNPLTRRAMLALTASTAAFAQEGRAQDALRGAGATFPAPVYQRWTAAYRVQTGQEVAYDAVGSGEGIARLARGAVDFGASDKPLDAAQLESLDAWQFPVLIGGVVPVVNLRGIAPGDLKLGGPLLARIFQGEVRAWNDPAIAALNPTLSLPSENITVVHRADASGTTFLWTDFLARKSPSWRERIGIGTTVDWPVGSAEAGNEGVAATVQRTRASLGYVEYAYARQHGLSDASVLNRAGRFVQASPASFAAAAAAATWATPADLAQVLVDQSGAPSWPIAGSTFIVLPRHPADARRGAALLDFFRWALAQGRADVIDLDYVPLPAAAVDLVGASWPRSPRPRVGGLGS